MEPSCGFHLCGMTPEVCREFCGCSLRRLLLGAKMAGNGVGPPQTVGDCSPDAMLGEGPKRSTFRRVEPARRLDQAEISRSHEVVEVHAGGEPFLEIPSDGNDEAEMPFREFVGRRPGCRFLASNALPFMSRHTSLLSLVGGFSSSPSAGVDHRVPSQLPAFRLRKSGRTYPQWPARGGGRLRGFTRETSGKSRWE